MPVAGLFVEKTGLSGSGSGYVYTHDRVKKLKASAGGSSWALCPSETWRSARCVSYSSGMLVLSPEVKIHQAQSSNLWKKINTSTLVTWDWLKKLLFPMELFLIIKSFFLNLGFFWGIGLYEDFESENSVLLTFFARTEWPSLTGGLKSSSSSLVTRRVFKARLLEVIEVMGLSRSEENWSVLLVVGTVVGVWIKSKRVANFLVRRLLSPRNLLDSFRHSR